MHHIAVVGAGQFGSRHLQGLHKLPVPIKLYVVDPMESSRARARERLAELPANPNVRNIEMVVDLRELPDRLDLAIVATTADVRLATIERLLERCDLSHVVLEKVLFQRLEEYETAGRLFMDRSVTAWVNCPRRMYESYEVVRDYFAASPVTYMHVQGGAWGLGCNGVHFADLFNYISGAYPDRYDIRQLYPAVHSSKRSGFVEFGGLMAGSADEARLRLVLESDTSSAQGHLITMRSGSRSCVIDEVSERAWLLDEVEDGGEISFRVPFQSELTADLALSILRDGVCALPDYATSMRVHVPFVRSLLEHYGGTTTAAVDRCPIT